MKPYISSAFVLALITLAAATASAGTPPPAEPVDGEAKIAMKNAEYVKVKVNGEDWDNIEFERNGKTVIVKGLSTTIERNAVTLVPLPETGLAPLDLDVLQKDFKKKRQGRVVYLVATKDVKFDKAAPAPEPGKEPAPKEPDIAPPPPAKDDL